jgi:Mg-chelatase subunit ChlI
VLDMGLGGNPYGPAGTGKTESVKALGGLFGRQVLVFNCDEVSMAQTHCNIRGEQGTKTNLVWP